MGGGEGAQDLPSQGDPALTPARIQTFLLSNIQRLITPSGKSKSKFLSDQAEAKNALFVAVTETWLNSDVLDAEVSHDFPDYTLYRCDRVGRQGGGVGLYLRNDLTGEIIGSSDNKVCELLVVHIHQINTVVAVAYRPPDTRYSEFDHLLSQLDNLLSLLPAPTPNIVLLGDFNFQDKNLSWARSTEGFLVPLVHAHRLGAASESSHHVRQQAAKLCDVARKHSLIQKVHQATHGKEILDLIFTNNSDLVSSVTVEAWPVFTDHSLVPATTSFLVEKKEELEEIHLL